MDLEMARAEVVTLVGVAVEDEVGGSEGQGRVQTLAEVAIAGCVGYCKGQCFALAGVAVYDDVWWSSRNGNKSECTR